jgi:hypothetical protein
MRKTEIEKFIQDSLFHRDYNFFVSQSLNFAIIRHLKPKEVTWMVSE